MHFFDINLTTYIQNIDERKIFVVDPMLATGGSACDAIELLKEKGVKKMNEEMMSEEKQIEEKDKRAYDCDECEHFRVCYKIHQYHVQQINTGLYCPSFKRKQSEGEWISVEERLPERNGRYLTHCNIEGQSLVCILYYCKIGGFNEGTVTHWMPLPEPPEGDES